MSQLQRSNNPPTRALRTLYLDSLEEPQELFVEKLVVDLRFNSGGNNSLNRSLLHALIRCPEIQDPGSLFVIVGRQTVIVEAAEKDRPLVICFKVEFRASVRLAVQFDRPPLRAGANPPRVDMERVTIKLDSLCDMIPARNDLLNCEKIPLRNPKGLRPKTSW